MCYLKTESQFVNFLKKKKKKNLPSESFFNGQANLERSVPQFLGIHCMHNVC